MNKDVFKGKKIVLGVTGCIAAYKSAYLVRDLIKRGAEVRIVMTPAATQFITPLTLSTLSNNNVIVNIFPDSTDTSTGLTTWHIDLAQWADIILIAPATVNTIAKIANGFADNALTTLVSAARSLVAIAPAADVDMYQNPVTQENILKLEAIGYYIIHSEAGELASGLSGFGRLADLNKIVDATELLLSNNKKDLRGKRILITAGPTFEDIDPVRFIGNRSSGKMGFALAKAAYLRSAKVTLISGPTAENVYPEIERINVRSSGDMKKAVEKELKRNDILIMSSAVADYKPAKTATQKLKKEDKLSGIKLLPTDDILASIKKDKKIIVGFALETTNEISNAKKKLKEKKLDLIVLNSLKDKESGFEYDTNKITILKKTERPVKFPLMSKFQAANKILTEILNVIL